MKDSLDHQQHSYNNEKNGTKADQYNNAFSFSNDIKNSDKFPGSLCVKLLDHFFKINWLNQKIQHLSKNQNTRTSNQFILQNIADAMLEEGKIHIHYQNNASIPDTGGCIIVATHSSYTLDALLLMREIFKKRNDVKFIAHKGVKNKLLLPVIFPIDISPQKSRQIKSNAATYKQAIQWIKDGKVLVVFPENTLETPNEAGSSSNKLLPWSTLPQRFAKLTGASIIPVKISVPIQGAARLCQQTCIFCATKKLNKAAYLFRGLAALFSFRQYYFIRKKTVSLTIGEKIMADSSLSRGNKLRDHVYGLDK